MRFGRPCTPLLHPFNRSHSLGRHRRRGPCRVCEGNPSSFVDKEACQHPAAGFHAAYAVCTVRPKRSVETGKTRCGFLCPTSTLTKDPSRVACGQVGPFNSWYHVLIAEVYSVQSL